MKIIQFCINHNTKECSATFGVPFQYEGCLMNLPAVKDGKRTHVLGLTPFTVEQVISIPFSMHQEASRIIYSYDYDVTLMIEKLCALTLIEADNAFNKGVDEYWRNELAKPQPKIHYLPTAQRGAESLIGPIEQL